LACSFPYGKLNDPYEKFNDKKEQEMDDDFLAYTNGWIGVFPGRDKQNS
jgi:hypothetical protein